MSYQALARKYRPQTFADIVGQETTVQTLQNAIENDRIHHAYLFSGVRGVGKTTLARILAKALNCVHGPTKEPDNTCVICREITEGIDLDVREIDAATYTGVDNVRELRDVTQYEPARDRYRIFIIDEAHMLSVASWNALLKLIEEPPPHVIFMFATTEMNKVPQTIISRVQRINLRKLTLEEIIGRLRTICNAEGIEAEREALEIVARRGEGSVRDALSLLDQVIAFAGRSITAADVATVLGLSETTFFARLVTLIGEGDHGGILEALNEAAASGRDFKMLFRDLLNFVRNLLLLAGGANEAMLSVSPEDLAVIREAAKTFSYTELLRIANLLLRDDETVNKAEHQRLAVEIALLKAATFPRLRAVEEALSGAPASTPAGPPPSRRRDAASPAVGTTAFLDRVKKARPGTAAFLADAPIALDGNVLRVTIADAFAAERVRDAQSLLDEIARELFGATVEITVEEKGAESAKAQPLREDPVVKAFQKHLGGELVEPRKR
ncbi:MAG TPA: DNA polymerase III subunit gamma/tau [Thermoanaerobaculia bacterium]|nr:DNA polymerase III subunit gamma/tau [Thermoanaerobaculia bacterium]